MKHLRPATNFIFLAFGLLAGYFTFRPGTLHYGTAVIGFLVGFYFATALFAFYLRTSGYHIQDGEVKKIDPAPPRAR